MLELLIVAGAGLAVSMSIAWIVQRHTGNSGWIDTFWTFSTGGAACFMALMPIADYVPVQPRQILVASLAAAWSLRLGWHILHRTRITSDDPRYRDMIGNWGDKAAQNLFWHLQVQALVALLLAGCVMLAAHNPQPLLHGLDVAAVALFLLGFAGEAIADAQLRKFRQSAGHSGQICDEGLWRYSRHPNYFCEWLCWLSFPLLASNISGDYWVGLGAVAAPVCIFWLLVYVSGVPPLEAHMERTRPAAFARYKATTPAFFPRMPLTG